MEFWTQSKGNIFVAAHRGWRSRYPENTLLAFRKALELGVDQIETDVRVTADGELVLIHDDSVDRTTNGTGRVEEMTYAQLQELDAGQGEKIPTLRQLLELVQAHPTVTLDIELKEYPTEGREALSYEVCRRVLEMLEAYGFRERTVINTWNGMLQGHIHETYGDKWKQHLYYPRRLMGAYTEDPFTYGYCTCVFGILDGQLPLEEVQQLEKDTGVRIWAGAYAKDESSVLESVRYGAELITCDNPDEVLEILRKHKLYK